MPRLRHLLPLIVLTAGPLLAAPARASFEEHVQVRADRLLLRNLIGEVTVEPASGDAFEIDIRVQGRDATRDRIKIHKHVDGNAEVAIRFPLDESGDYVYPALGSRSRSTFFVRDGDLKEESWLEKLITGVGGKKVTVRGDGDGLEIWADVTVRVPAGRDFRLSHGAGKAAARGLTGDLTLDNHVGPLEVSSVKGKVVLDTGSGAVRAEDVTGDLSIDTGSGGVRARGVEGEVLVDTGSGGVSLADVRADRVSVDTGSGDVVLAGIACRELLVDTGSGSVQATGISADSADLDTGSGGVVLELDRMGTGTFVVDTGSGSIELAVPKDASAEVDASCGSGLIHVDFEDEDVHRTARDDLRFRIGEGGARVTLDTGSGSIRVRG